MDQQNTACPYNSISSKANDVALSGAATWMDLENIMLSESSQPQKTTRCGSVYMKYIEAAEPERQKGD